MLESVTATLEDIVPLSNRRKVAPVLAAALVAATATGAAARDSGPPPPAVTEAFDAGPRNLEAEAATGDIDAMRGVVQEIVDCLRAKGFHPGDPEVRGDSVLIADWSPGWTSAAGRATHECSFPEG